jgi:xylulokinase
MSSAAAPLVIGVDASTTACKALVVDPEGREVASGRAAYGLDNPGPDAWEQDARAWREAATAAIASAARALDAAARARVRAVAVTHQRETFVVTDEEGEPLAPAIVWMDARARPEVAAACRELDPGRIHAISGKPPCVTPSLYKIRALFERLRPELRTSARRVLDVHAFLVLSLTGELVTSTAAADPLGIVDMRGATWSDELAGLARVSPAMLPPLVRPGTVVGRLRPNVIDATGLPADVLVVAGAGDGQAAGLGAGVVEEDAAYLNLGTAIVSGKPSRAYRTSSAWRTLFAASGDGYLLETDLKGGTFTLDWLAERLLGSGELTGGRGRLATLAALEAQAVAVRPGSEGLVALPYWAGVMNPFWNDDASGALVGLRGDHGPEHVYRAICEGIALEQRLHTERVEAEAGRIARIVAVGGGAQRAFFAGLVADVLGRTLVRSREPETTALGAAVLAAAGGGVHAGVAQAARAMTAAGDAITPGEARIAYDRLYRDVYRGLYQAALPVLAALARYRAGPPA